MSGQPEDSQYIDNIEVSQQYTLRDLKEVILTMKQFEFAQAFVSNKYANYSFSHLNKSESERNRETCSMVEF